MIVSLGSSAFSEPWGLRRGLSDDLRERFEPLLRERECRTTASRWEHLPQELGVVCGMTRWHRPRDWNEFGVWQQLYEVLPAELNAAARLDWSRAVVDSSHVRALTGGGRQARRKPQPVFADRGYDHDTYRDQVWACQMLPSTIPCPLGATGRHP